jgi:hypothetical protein
MDIYYDPYAHAIREVAELHAILTGTGEREEGEQVRAILKRMVDGQPHGAEDDATLQRLRLKYAAELAAARLGAAP